MKSGSMAAFEQARNVEDATDGAEETPRKKRGTVPLSVEAVLKDARARRDTSAARVAELRAIAEKAIRETDGKRLSERVARVPQNERADCVKMLAAIGIVVPVIDAEFRDPAVDGDEAAPESSVPDVADETPSRPALEEYDASGVMAPLTPERLAVAKGARR